MHFSICYSNFCCVILNFCIIFILFQNIIYAHYTYIDKKKTAMINAAGLLHLFTAVLFSFICTLGVFHALAFAADFPPVAPEFYQRTHRVRLKNLGTTDKKSSRKIKYKKIPRVHLFMIMSPQDDISFYHDFLPLIMLDQSLGSQISHAFIFQFFTDSKNIL